jgi:hypothetical protein
MFIKVRGLWVSTYAFRQNINYAQWMSQAMGKISCSPPPPSREGGISGKQAASWNGGSFRRVNSAGFSRGWIQQVAMADFSGGLFRRVILADYFGVFVWRVFMASKTSGFLKKRKAKEKEEKCTLSRPGNCIKIIVYSQ